MNDIKLLAFYLPQFHTFYENNKWWGEGFTEWVNVRSAKPLYPGHNQPRIPENNNYYDLADENVLTTQMDLAKKFNIYGFCYYHYWFNGKLLLQKPLEKMLKLKERINYCFCWANEPWTRSWEGREKEILMPQFYGDEKDWENHFKYLLDFFCDDYYIKVDNKPVLVIYRTNNIPNCDKMIEYWNMRCLQERFNGIYIIEEKNSFQKEPVCTNSEAVLEFEPMYTLKFGRSYTHRFFDKINSFLLNKRYHNHLLFYKYDKVWRTILKRSDYLCCSKKTYLGAFVDWDNTPRKKDRGLVIQGASPEKFFEYFNQQVTRARSIDSEFLFINAWNEWGEGTYLEPDLSNGKKYLSAVRKSLME